MPLPPQTTLNFVDRFDVTLPYPELPLPHPLSEILYQPLHLFLCLAGSTHALSALLTPTDYTLHQPLHSPVSALSPTYHIYNKLRASSLQSVYWPVDPGRADFSGRPLDLVRALFQVFAHQVPDYDRWLDGL